ncbi:MAG TPA: hypothetical protein VEX88_09045 [Glaciibacter sp.]|nr:hypothetical protein [Glaciibacter sp.]
MKQPNDNHEQPTRRRVPGRRTVALGVAAVAAIALSATAYISGQAPSTENTASSGTRTSSESVAVAPAESGTEGLAQTGESQSNKAPGVADKPDAPLPPDHAKARIKKFLDVTVPADPAAPGSDAELEDAARGAIREEVANDKQELKANGWSRRGNATVESVTIISSDITTDPATSIAHACVDSSKVVTLDADKKPVGSSGTGTQRALNIYTLHYIADEWRVVARSFPDNPAC